MKKIPLICLFILLACACVSCKMEGQQHEHTPDDADCQRAQYCIDCGEQLAEQGSHDYPDLPNTERDGYLFFVCRICGKIEIVNENGVPVVPVE